MIVGHGAKSSACPVTNNKDILSGPKKNYIEFDLNGHSLSLSMPDFHLWHHLQTKFVRYLPTGCFPVRI